MIVNNIDKVKKLFDFRTSDDFYYLQVLKRKKENTNLGSNSYLVKSYFINSVEYFDSKVDEIINLCEFHNARAYINLNRRSFEKIAYETNLKLANQLKNRDFYSVRKVYDSVCGTSEGMNQKNRRWVVDIDVKDMDFIKEVINFIEEIEPIPNFDEDRVIELMETKNGVHLITHGFNSQIFKSRYPEIDIQRNNPTILYI